MEASALPAVLVSLAVLAVFVVLALVLLFAVVTLLARRRQREYDPIPKPTRFDLDVDGLMRLLEKRKSASGAMQSLVRMTWDGDSRLTKKIVARLMARCIKADPAVTRDWKDYGAGMARRTLIQCGDPALQVARIHLRRQSPKTARAAGFVLAGLAARGEVSVSDEIIEMVELKGGMPWSHWEGLAKVWLAELDRDLSLQGRSASPGQAAEGGSVAVAAPKSPA